eukprot:XP_008674923.1 uncharacterized protein LOC103651096 [Zea mays]
MASSSTPTLTLGQPQSPSAAARPDARMASSSTPTNTVDEQGRNVDKDLPLPPPSKKSHVATTAKSKKKIHVATTNAKAVQGEATFLGFFETLIGQNSDQCVLKVDEVKESLCDLMKYYEMEEGEDTTESSTPLLDTSLLSTISARVASRRPAMTRVKTELDRYLEDDLVHFSTENFQILDWWKDSCFCIVA